MVVLQENREAGVVGEVDVAGVVVEVKGLEVVSGKVKVWVTYQS